MPHNPKVYQKDSGENYCQIKFMSTIPIKVINKSYLWTDNVDNDQ